MEMREGNNIVQMGEDVNKVLEEYEKELPDDVSIFRITDQSQVVGDSVTTFLRELLIAIIAVIIVVMLLMPLRVASVAASTIPITIFLSLLVFYACGLELNTVTLAALIATLGMIVDNSIVIIDCCMEKLDSGIDRWTAAIESAKEFFKSILSATLAISITFFPFLITSQGMINDFLQSFPWAITIILFLSLLVAVLLVPYIQYHFIHTGFRKQPKKEKKQRRSFLTILQSSYDKLIVKCFAHPIRTMGVGLLSIVAGVVIFLSLPMKLMPFAERNQFAVEIYMPFGTALEQTAAVADSLESILRQDSRVVSVASFKGDASPRFHTSYAPQMPGSNYAQFIVNTIGNKATEEMIAEYKDKYLNYFPNVRVRFKQLEYSEAAYLVRNGIIMLDYADELREKEGLTVREAALHSAKRRMRPIFLTSAAASMGVIPMILGGSPLWSPMGSVVFFGTIVSMVLTVTILPVAYWLIFSRADRKSINH